MNQVQLEQNVVGGLQVPSRLWLMLGICSLSVLESCKKNIACACFYVWQRDNVMEREGEI